MLAITGLLVTTLALQQFASILAPVLFALVLVIGIHPLTGMLRRHGAAQWLAVTITLIVLLVVIVGLAAASAISLAELGTILPTYQDRFAALLADLRDWLASLGIGPQQLQAALGSISFANLAGIVTSLLAALAGAFSSLLFVVFVVLFMGLDAGTFSRRLALASSHRAAVVTALGGFVRGTRSYLIVSTVFGLIVAVIDAGVLWVLGVPGALLWGLLAFITNYIPNIGFLIGLAPPALLALLEGGPRLMVIVIVAYVVINFVIQSVIQPKYVSDAVNISLTLTFLSLVFWTFVIGPLGAVLAIPLTLLTKALLLDIDPNTRWISTSWRAGRRRPRSYCLQAWRARTVVPQPEQTSEDREPRTGRRSRVMISERVRGLLARYHDSLPMRVSRRMIAIGGYDRALALSSQAFGALVPLLLLVSQAVDDPNRAAAMAGGLGLSPSAAVTLAGLVTPQAPSTSLTVLGAVLLVVSVFGFIRALQPTFTATWNRPSTGARGYWRGVLAAVTLVVEFATLVLLAPVLAVARQRRRGPRGTHRDRNLAVVADPVGAPGWTCWMATAAAGSADHRARTVRTGPRVQRLPADRGVALDRAPGCRRDRGGPAVLAGRPRTGAGGVRRDRRRAHQAPARPGARTSLRIRGGGSTPVTVSATTLVLVPAAIALAPLLATWFGRVVRIPLVVFEIAFGILLGPAVLAWVAPDQIISRLADFGLAMLFFLAGSEIDINRIRGRVLNRSIAGWLVALAAGLAVGICLGALLGYGAIAGVFVGIALTSTALGTIMPMLRDAGELHTPFGTAVIGIGTAGEFGPLIAISLFLSGRNPGTAALVLLAFALVAAAAILISARGRHRHLHTMITTTLRTSGQFAVRFVILIVAALVALSLVLGLDMLLGAFAAGLVIRFVLDDATPADREAVETKLEAVGFGFLIPVFFVVTGLRFDLKALTGSPTALLLLAVFAVLLLLIRGLTGLFTAPPGASARDRRAIVLLAATGLPIIVAVTDIGTTTGDLPAALATALVGAGMLSVLLFPLIALAQRGTSRSLAKDIALDDDVPDEA